MSSSLLTEILAGASDLDDPVPLSNKRATILGVTIAFMILSWCCGIFRLYTRYFIVHSLGWDDFFLVLLLVTSLSGGVTICMLPSYGMGGHLLLMSLPEIQSFLKLYYIGNASYVMATTFIKISLLLQYLRIYKDRAIRAICIGLLVVISLWGSAYTVLAWMPCVPVSDFWTLSLDETNRKCFAYGAVTSNAFVTTFISQAASNMAFDVLVLSLPMYFFFTMKAAAAKRIALTGLMIGGCLVVFVSIWRLQGLIEHRAATAPSFDPTWYAPVTVLLSTIELDLASMCASLPVFWPVLTDTLGEIFVTKEVQVIYEDRMDEFELHQYGSRDQGASFDYPPGTDRYVSRNESRISVLQFGRNTPFAREEDEKIIMEHTTKKTSRRLQKQQAWQGQR
ncbi:hypothetical protein BX600DRAFT_497070 [Xylariales sp. PMI_506]|nr:hypothetical protein BX600DRAFT_497070 [Xylariales sp. PMI_506]